MTERQRKKELGAFYTDPRVADFLVSWAVRSQSDTVLDPSFGTGVFLEAAFNQLSESENRSNQIHGVEFDKSTYKTTLRKLGKRINSKHLILSDFFDIAGVSPQQSLVESELPAVDAVVGNPPFIRYHQFKGKMRERALQKSKELGVELNGLSSSWAPFVVHATSFVKDGGRLAMVMPAELMHAYYALPVTAYLKDTFQSMTIITFRKKIFPNLSQDTILVLCDQKAVKFRSMHIVDLESSDSLKRPLPTGEFVDADTIVSGESRLIEYLLPEETRELYDGLKHDKRVSTLGTVADVGIGYVTGNNDYFHLTMEQALQHGIADDYMSRCVRNGRQLAGLLLTDGDCQSLLDCGEPNLLLNLGNAGGNLPTPILRFIELGEGMGVHKAYKCRARNPWYIVPHIYECDALLTYMSGKQAKLVVNEAKVVVPNTLHTVRLRDPDHVSVYELAVSWSTSLTSLSAEIEGHSMGGGMLKLEPSEAQRTIVAIPSFGTNAIKPLVQEIDILLRQGEWEAANSLADKAILKEGMGLSDSEILLLRQGADQLRHRRYSR